jgi:rhamnose utilization protein RhaD (predicted bifunctional aldolase and dehydrogenase)
MKTEQILTELITLSRELGREERQLAILGEGNTSALCEDKTFWVKASGSYLGTIDQSGFSQVKLDEALAFLNQSELNDHQIAEGLQKALVNPAHRKPSVETFLHAVFLTEGGAKWVGHTHPISVNSILCSKLGAEPFLHHLFPDEIVVCGRHPVVVPYTDPGLKLAIKVRDEIWDYQQKYGMSPKMVLMVNHGLVALGQTPKEVLNISLMADKWARIILGGYTLGGLSYLPEEQVDRIENRLDEQYRRSQLTKG